MTEMSTVYIVSGVRNHEREILAVVATMESADAAMEQWFGEGSAYSEGRIEVWGVGQ